MARHFTYKHLPASGLGHRDPRRPYATGGLGLGLPVFITDILEKRIYRGRGRDQMVMDRSLLNEARNLINSSRYYANDIELVPIHVNPVSDFFNSGWTDEAYGNNDGFVWDELAGRPGSIDGYILDSGVSIPETPPQSSVAFIVNLEPVDDPGTNKDHFLALRAFGLKGEEYGFTATAVIASPDTGTIVKQVDVADPETGWVDFRFPLTEAEAAMLDYQSILLYLIVQDLLYHPVDNPYEHGLRTFRVNYMRLEIPSYRSRVTRYRERLDRILRGITRTLSAIGRSYRGGGRDMGSDDRDLE